MADQEQSVFQKALSNFIHDFASGGAIRHLADAGLTVTEIAAYVKEQLSNEIWEEEQRFENPHRHYLDMTQKYYKMKTDLLESVKVV